MNISAEQKYADKAKQWPKLQYANWKPRPKFKEKRNTKWREDRITSQQGCWYLLATDLFVHIKLQCHSFKKKKKVHYF